MGHPIFYPMSNDFSLPRNLTCPSASAAAAIVDNKVLRVDMIECGWGLDYDVVRKIFVGKGDIAGIRNNEDGFDSGNPIAAKAQNLQVLAKFVLVSFVNQKIVWFHRDNVDLGRNRLEHVSVRHVEKDVILDEMEIDVELLLGIPIRGHPILFRFQLAHHHLANV